MQTGSVTLINYINHKARLKSVICYRGSLTIIAFTVFIIITCFPACSPGVEWVSPYKEIDWDNIIQAKAQLHAHTTRSDGYFSPHFVVDRYHNLGYDVLAITDHWLVTYPWQEFSTFEVSGRTYRRQDEGELNGIPHEDVFVYKNRDPEALGMLAIKGSEPSHTGPRNHHMVSLFSDVSGSGMDFSETLAANEEAGGLISFAHPARSTERNNNNVEDYIYFFDNYPHIYGIDIFTRATFREPERWPYSKKLLSDLLMHYGSAGTDGWRPVWMTSTDDLHRIGDIDQGYQVQLVDKLDHENVYNSLKDGAFFWVAKAPNEQAPVIGSVHFDRTSITVNGAGYDDVSWYFDNKVVHTGETFDFFENGLEDMFYVYFLAHTADFSVEEGKGALIGSQPFWIKR